MNIEDFSKPKRRIFETAIQLFAKNSFENVSLDDIASSLNRKKPSIYNHFSSKQEIMETMYLFFEAHIFDQRKTMDELKVIFKTASILDMMLAMSFQFRTEYADILSGILTVIHQRKFFDERARIIAKTYLVDEGIRYVEAAFNYAVEAGILAPFNTHWLALVINDTRNGEYTRFVINPEHNRADYIRNEEFHVYQHAAALITDLRPSPISQNTPSL